MFVSVVIMAEDSKRNNFFTIQDGIPTNALIA
jgi:hypothetical protein